MDSFYFCVKDNAMSADRIHEGDLVRIDHCDANPEDIVLVCESSALLLRRVKHLGNTYLLIPSNPNVAQSEHTSVAVIGRVASSMHLH